jgi:hypothetical protein
VRIPLHVVELHACPFRPVVQDHLDARLVQVLVDVSDLLK